MGFGIAAEGTGSIDQKWSPFRDHTLGGVLVNYCVIRALISWYTL